jgi:hypothetical protein
VGALVLMALVTSASDCLDDIEPPPCQANCAIEAECEFRSLEDCEAAACEPLTGAPINVGLDACLGAATDCLEAAACACPDGCGQIDECAGEADPSCVENCDTLVEQLPVETYLENLCRIESSCEDLALCSSVQG